MADIQGMPTPDILLLHTKSQDYALMYMHAQFVLYVAHSNDTVWHSQLDALGAQLNHLEVEQWLDTIKVWAAFNDAEIRTTIKSMYDGGRQ